MHTNISNTKRLAANQEQLVGENKTGVVLVWKLKTWRGHFSLTSHIIRQKGGHGKKNKPIHATGCGLKH